MRMKQSHGMGWGSAASWGLPGFAAAIRGEAMGSIPCRTICRPAARGGRLGAMAIGGDRRVARKSRLEGAHRRSCPKCNHRARREKNDSVLEREGEIRLPRFAGILRSGFIAEKRFATLPCAAEEGLCPNGLHGTSAAAYCGATADRHNPDAAHAASAASGVWTESPRLKATAAWVIWPRCTLRPARNPGSARIAAKPPAASASP